LRRSRETENAENSANEFSQIVADLTEFLMPAAKAAETLAEYPERWEPHGPWRYG